MTTYIEPHEFEPRSRDPQECRRCYSDKAHHPFNLEEKSNYRPGWHTARPYEPADLKPPTRELVLLVGGLLLCIAAAVAAPASPVLAVIAVVVGLSSMFVALRMQRLRFERRR